MLVGEILETNASVVISVTPGQTPERLSLTTSARGADAELGRAAGKPGKAAAQILRPHPGSDDSAELEGRVRLFEPPPGMGIRPVASGC